jgi:hypothetical protein
MEKNNINQYQSQLLTMRFNEECIQINISTDVLNGNKTKVLLFKSTNENDFINFEDTNLIYNNLDFEQTVELCYTYFIDKGYIAEI